MWSQSSIITFYRQIITFFRTNYNFLRTNYNFFTEPIDLFLPTPHYYLLLTLTLYKVYIFIYTATTFIDE